MTRDELVQAMYDAHPGDLHDAICDYLIKTTRDGMYDNAHDTGWDDGKEETGLVPESDDERLGKETYDAAGAPDAKNVSVAYHLGHALAGLMDDVQGELRTRFGLPAWNVMHECADMIGDTDGIPTAEELQETEDYRRLAVENPIVTCKWCHETCDSLVDGKPRLSCPYCHAGFGS